MKNIINSTWDTLDMPTKASIMKEALLKGITDIDIIKKNYDSKYLNVNMLPQVEDNFSKEQLYDLYNKVEGSNRSNNMYPSNSYGNLFVNGGKKDGDDWHEGVYLTDFGAHKSYRKNTKYPLYITLTEKEYKELKDKVRNVTFDYSKVKKDLRPIDNVTTLLAVPGSFILKYYPDIKDEGSITYVFDHSTAGPDADGNYTIYKLNLNTALGLHYTKWKLELEDYRRMASNPNPYGINEDEGQVDYIPLDELVITKDVNTGKLFGNYSEDNNTEVKTASTTSNAITPTVPDLNIDGNSGVTDKKYINPLGLTGTLERLPVGDSNRNGVVGGSPFGELGGIEMPARSFPEDNGIGLYYPGGYGGNYGYYGYQPSNILINWPTNYNLPDYSGEYDASHNGVPVEKLPFIENDKLNLNDLLAWIQTLLNNKGYPVDGESEFTLPKRSKLITPKHTDVLLTESHVFNNKKAMGGRINKFETGGNKTQIEENIYSPFTINGITYGIIPNLIADASKGISDLEGNDVVGTPLYVKYNPLKKKWENTTMAKDADNIRAYKNRSKLVGTILGISEDGETLYGTLPDLIVGSVDNKDSLPATYDEKAKSAGAYDPYNNPSISAQLNNLFNGDPVIKELRRRILDTYLKLYNASDFLNTIIPMHLISPTNYVGAIGEAARGNANFFLNVLSGHNRGLFSLSDDLYNWSTEHPYISTGINMVGDMALGAAVAKPFMDWRNPNSLWSLNIRTSFANDKIPFAYILKDSDNIMPYIKGTYATLKGKRIPLENRLQKAIDRSFDSDLFGEVPRALPNETYQLYLQRTGLPHSTEIERWYNRLGMWNLYLGVGDESHNLNMSIHNRSENYIRKPDGTYDINLTKEEEANFLTPKGNSKVGDNYRYITYDYDIGNHANVGALLAYEDGKLVSVLNDPFDLHPIQAITKRLPKSFKWLEKYIPSPEVSSILPAGAEPVTFKHIIPIEENGFAGIVWDNGLIIRPILREEAKDIINNGSFLTTDIPTITKVTR